MTWDNDLHNYAQSLGDIQGDLFTLINGINDDIRVAKEDGYEDGHAKGYDEGYEQGCKDTEKEAE